ncbi:1-acylglycerol-3-phosphate O-acyltransferase-like protein [Ramlibacter tataouinensis TTB310]|uniref:1-acylglycerol-3-phosphate O-acyltransferase-like protein n=1 Tax=Ramlibacter tataouinensis (strain ATCC BAA-407 / DSM 14655 / LMG 21543 / TTB310) TaxID=365046 RepID=F5Y4L4_RAMTT|nr:1-acylglycerol-3-phosphate O-acyltransferase-like protein [Ramlibacter tataouinensis TTB310]
MPHRALGRLRDAARLHLGFAALAALCLVSSTLGSAAALLMRPARRGPFARRLICWIFGTHLRLMERLGAVRLDLSALDTLEGEPPLVLAPNHPSMIDAALMLSRLTRLTCVMKADILENPLFGVGARMAGYITNDPPRQMMRAAGDSLQDGRHLLLFPEGTRTRQRPLNALQRTAGVIARRAGVPVQTLIIETSSPFLCKGWPLFRAPAMPLVYRVRLGRRFDPPADVEAFTSELEAYFQQELATARLPPLPLPPDAR